MDIHCETRDDGIGVVAPRGELTAPYAQAFRDRFRDWFGEAQPQKVVIDMSGVGFMDSTGLGVLIFALKHVASRDSVLALCAVQDKPRMVIEITRTYRVLDIYDDLDEAVRVLR